MRCMLAKDRRGHPYGHLRPVALCVPVQIAIRNASDRGAAHFAQLALREARAAELMKESLLDGVRSILHSSN